MENFIILCIINWCYCSYHSLYDPLLLNENESVTQSPFTIVFDRIGVAFAASVINAVILTSLLSATNSGVYTTSRMLFSLSDEKQAPKFLSKLNENPNYL